MLFLEKIGALFLKKSLQIIEKILLLLTWQGENSKMYKV